MLDCSSRLIPYAWKSKHENLKSHSFLFSTLLSCPNVKAKIFFFLLYLHKFKSIYYFQILIIEFSLYYLQRFIAPQFVVNLDLDLDQFFPSLKYWKHPFSPDLTKCINIPGTVYLRRRSNFYLY